MISKARIWMGIGKPKNPHSIENLKYFFTNLKIKNLIYFSILDTFTEF